jgi:hypothetical protein
LNARTALLGLFMALTLVLASTTLYEATSKTTMTSTSTQMETSTTMLQPPVEPSVYEWGYYLQSRDVDSLASMYAPAANVTLTGDIAGISPLGGMYNGREHIEILYGSWLGKDSALSANITNYSQETIGSSFENVAFSLTTVGNSSVLGSFRMAANVTQGWSYAGGQWQISNETWDFTTYDISFP